MNLEPGGLGRLNQESRKAGIFTAVYEFLASRFSPHFLVSRFICPYW